MTTDQRLHKIEKLLSQLVAEKQKAEWITPAEWMNRTGKTQGQLSWAIRQHEGLKEKRTGVRCAINWTMYCELYPIHKKAS